MGGELYALDVDLTLHYSVAFCAALNVTCLLLTIQLYLPDYDRPVIAKWYYHPLLRPAITTHRLDQHIEVPLPNTEDRRNVLRAQVRQSVGW